jgi:hypothetical protein
MHRFLPTLIRMEGFTVAEVPITHRPRFSGRSHYGLWDRLLTSTCDLLAVRWMQQRMASFQINETVNLLAPGTRRPQAAAAKSSPAEEAHEPRARFVGEGEWDASACSRQRESVQV